MICGGVDGDTHTQALLGGVGIGSQADNKASANPTSRFDSGPQISETIDTRTQSAYNTKKPC
jgi:hypothetical protein